MTLSILHLTPSLGYSIYMINAIRGKLLSVTDNSLIVLTEGGVEFYLECSLNSANKFRSLSQEEKMNVRVFSVLNHREDAMTLFGFFDERERFCFIELQTVPGIGPKGALKILGGITVDDLCLALDSQDVKKLSKVPGLGAKTAQKLILQLRNVLVFDNDENESIDKPTSTQKRFSEFISSFSEMGYDRKSVVKAIDSVLDENPEKYKNMNDRDIEKTIFSSVLRRLN